MVHEIQGDGQDGNGLILYTSPRQPAQPVSLPLCSHYSPPCRIGLRTKPHSTKIMFSPLVLTSRCLICHHPQLVCSAGGLSGQSHSPQAPTHPSVNSRSGLLHSQKSKSRVVIVVVVGARCGPKHVSDRPPSTTTTMTTRDLLFWLCRRPGLEFTDGCVGACGL